MGPKSSALLRVWLLRDNFPCIKLNQHGGIGLQVFHRNSQAKVVEQQELKFEVVQFSQGETANLKTTLALVLMMMIIDQKQKHTLAYRELV